MTDERVFLVHRESATQHAVRTKELLTQIQYAAHDCIILVAHSDTVNELIRSHLHQNVQERSDPKLEEQLWAGSTAPCSLVCCCLDFGQDASKPITNIASIR